MIWLKCTSDLSKPNRDQAFLCHSMWFLTYKPTISRTGWRKEGKAREKQQFCSDKAIPMFPGETWYGAHQSGPKKPPCQPNSPWKKSKCNKSGHRLPLQDLCLLNLKMKDEAWKINYLSLNWVLCSPLCWLPTAQEEICRTRAQALLNAASKTLQARMVSA